MPNLLRAHSSPHAPGQRPSPRRRDALAPRHRRGGGRGRLAAVGLCVLVSLAILLPATPATAHVAIRLDVMAPQANQAIGSDSELVVVARPMLLGVPETTFTATLDGRPVDPISGRVTDQPVPVLIRVNETKRIPLRGLTAGSHTLGVSYRPDRDAPVLHSTVPVVVRPSRPARWLLSAAGIAVLLTAVLVVARRCRRSEPKADPSTVRQ